MKTRIKGIGVEIDRNGKDTGRFYITFKNNHKLFTEGKLTKETEKLIRNLQAEVMR